MPQKMSIKEVLRTLAPIGIITASVLAGACKTRESGNAAAAPSTSQNSAPAPPQRPRSAAPHPLAGNWRSTLAVEKRTVRLPSDASTTTWSRDKGKRATGEVVLTLRISTTGEIRGEGKGALGALTLTGKVTDKDLRATITATDPNDPLGMHGVLLGAAKGAVLEVRLRTSGHDASLVRGGEGVLERVGTP